jgi:hypothetical protein
MGMPAKAKLSQGEIAVLEEWVMRGALDPRATVLEWKGVKKGGVDVEEGRKHWSYHPVRDTTPPVVREQAWPLNEVGYFTLAKQEAAGLRPGPEAESHGWLRRVTFDLTGLPPPAADAAAQSRRFDFIQRMNTRLLAQSETDARMEGMIHNLETAFRMQAATPNLVDLSNETEATKKLYGIGEKTTDKNGRACLLARRLSEAGVRFVQVTMDGWDHHGDIRGALPKSCAARDLPCPGLIRDLKSRGLLEDTLLVWSGEFGRTPWSQDLSRTAPIEKHGREHQPESFCTWLAEGGARGGLMHGGTDEFGFRPVSGKVHLHDFHATILHLLGRDHPRLTWRHLGRDFRLTDVYGEEVREILV